MSVRHVVVAEYKYLFQDFSIHKEDAIQGYIKGINLKTAFPVVARLNYSIRKEGFSSITEELIYWFGSQSPQVEIYKKRILNAYPPTEVKSVRIMNIWSNLRLLELILNNLDEPEIEQDVESVSDKLLKAYLLINETYITSFNHRKIMDSIPDIFGKLQKTALTITTMLLPYHDLNHIDANDAFVAHFIKAIYFFQFAEEHMPEMLQGFLKSYGVESWREYIIVLIPVADHALQRNKEGLGYLNVNASQLNYKTTQKFLTMLSVGGGFIENPEIDFILLRSKPLMQVDTDRFLVIDNLLVFNKIYNSLYFEFNALLEDDPELFKKGDFKGYLNSHFSEDYLAKAVLDIVFKNEKYKKMSGAEIKKKHQKKFAAEPDYYVRYNDEIYLFELKDTYVRGDVKQSFDATKILTELKLKLWVKEFEKDGVPKASSKAVLQLINNIKRIIEDKLPFDDGLKDKKLVIFPVLLYIDQSLSTPGLNEIVQNWFFMEMGKEPAIVEASDRVQIMPLTMIDLDTLILMQDDFKDNELDLPEIIYFYWKHKQEQVMKGFQEESFQQVSKGMLPFAAFIRMGRTKRRTPDIFMEFAKIIFDK